MGASFETLSLQWAQSREGEVGLLGGSRLRDSEPAVGPEPGGGAAFETLSLQWAQSREGKVRLAVLEALGPMSALLAPEQLQEQLPRLLPAVLGLYRRHPEPFPISKSLCQLLEAWAARGSRALEPHLEPLLGALLAQMCAPADPNIPTSSKNHTELLRCFSVLAGPFPERLVQWLLPRLESGPERHRQGALLLLRHLLNSNRERRVRRALVQLISALAHHGHLQQPGAEALLEFLVHQCALPSDKPPGIPEENPEDPTSDDVRSVSVSTLLLLSSTVPGITH
ncbi:maestro heat-like repeat-containing protein family member 1, partial [Passer montanus]|uniref:maestro heat-like repeat-containing protein family member 1 n=1 Tax=Passer montanus TaxID=9160 RepID=UPI0019619E33